MTFPERDLASGIMQIGGCSRGQPVPAWATSSAMKELLHHCSQKPESVLVQNNVKIQSFGMFPPYPKTHGGALLGDIPDQENNISRQVLRLYCYVSRQKPISSDIFSNFILNFGNIDAGNMPYPAE
ncbi:hypothetical protein [Agrobacterium arsenijevicii]